MPGIPNLFSIGHKPPIRSWQQEKGIFCFQILPSFDINLEQTAGKTREKQSIYENKIFSAGPVGLFVPTFIIIIAFQKPELMFTRRLVRL